MPRAADNCGSSAKPIAETLRQWLTRQRTLVPDGSATAKAIEYSLGRWAALVRYIDDGDLPIGRVDDWRGKHTLQGVGVGRHRSIAAWSRALPPRFQADSRSPDHRHS